MMRAHLGDGEGKTACAKGMTYPSGERHGSFEPERDGRASGRLKAIGRIVLIFLASFLGLAVSGAQPGMEQVPFVGCPSDGQVGPLPAPGDGGKAPSLPHSQALALAYYESRDLGVLAPRGWHCFGLYGSNGSILIVTPEAHTADDLLASTSRIAGPAVQLSYSDGGTSGRFEVAGVAARLFPTEKAFVRKVIAEKVETAGDFLVGPYPYDVLTRRNATEVEFVTPPFRDGMGTRSRLLKNADPIEGLALLLKGDEDEDLVLLDVRMPSGLRHTVPAIVGAVRRQEYTAAPQP
jgi:hypothetical protein